MTTSRRLTFLAALTGLMAVIAAATFAGGAKAAPDKTCAGGTDGGPCVMLIQISGLEAKDVTPQNTPFLWAMAHPSATPSADNPFGPAPFLTGRAGFIWQAARSGMQASTAASTATLLTGSYARESGVPSDEYRDFLQGETPPLSLPGRVRLGADRNGDEIEELGFGQLHQRTLFELVKEDDDTVDNAAFVGDPALAPLIADVDLWAPGADPSEGNVDHVWYPRHNFSGDPEPPSQDNAPPLYCPVPRDPAGPDQSDAARVGCVAPDQQTLFNASQKLEGASPNNVGFTYIQLAELAATKRVTSDIDSLPNDTDPAQPSAVAKTLTQTDAALAMFFGRYTTQAATSGRWGKTVVMIVGDHGYEQTLPHKRVPDPNSADTPREDLQHFVADFTPAATATGPNPTRFEFIPQGTMGTVFCTEGCHKTTPPPGSPADDSPAEPSDAHKAALAELKTAIETQVNEECKGMPDGGDCIQEVLYTRPALGPANGPDSVPAKHPDWNLDTLRFEDGEPIGPSGSSGDLVVVLQPGWGAGKAAPTAGDVTGDGGESVTNPYLASSGGPRNRAIAAIVNGPADGFEPGKGVRAYNGASQNGATRYPVFCRQDGSNCVDADSSVATEVVNAIDPKCQSRESGLKAKYPATDVAQANANPVDDANAPGHVCQLELVDVAPTIASLFKVSMPAEQIAGRPLNEAFKEALAIPCEDCIPKIPTIFPIDGPWTQPRPGENPQIAAKNVKFLWATDEPTATFECALDARPEGQPEPPAPAHNWRPCGQVLAEREGTMYPSYTSGALKVGEHTFEVRGRSEAGPGDPIKADFEVVPFFDFQGILRTLRAHVTDRKGHPVNTTPLMRDDKTGKRIPRARRGTLMSNVDIRADFGRPFSAVKLTLYRKPRLPGGGCDRKGRCVLKALARFPAFKIVRGPVELLFRVPARGFSGDRRPTHIGITVRELKLTSGKLRNCQKDPTRRSCKFKEIGPRKGDIVSLHDSKYLNKRR